MAKNPGQPPDFEAALEELESIVKRMEAGNQSLEDSLRDFERGMALSKQCQSSLKLAQQRIEKILPDPGEDDNVPDGIDEQG